MRRSGRADANHPERQHLTLRLPDGNVFPCLEGVIAGETGISTDNIRAYEFDEKKPPEAHLAKLIEALGADLVSGPPGREVQAVIQTEAHDTGG